METHKKASDPKEHRFHIPLGAMWYEDLRLDSGEEVKKSDKENEHSIIRDSNVGIGSRLQNAFGGNRKAQPKTQRCVSVCGFFQQR